MDNLPPICCYASNGPAILDPTDQRHVWFGHATMNIFQITARLCYSFWAFIYKNVIHVMTSTFGFMFYQIYIYLPVWTQYQILQFKLRRRWVMLSISLWLIVITSKWKEPPLKPGKQVNCTY